MSVENSVPAVVNIRTLKIRFIAHNSLLGGWWIWLRVLLTSLQSSSVRNDKGTKKLNKEDYGAKSHVRVIR